MADKKNEVNPIPGFTSHSRYPNMMKGIGLNFGELLDRLLGAYLPDQVPGIPTA